ncbi:DUF892 family protein [uncultured Mucilaginibacter sp.]|uniref:DUF892 family protein n=1 Tax=uncultured Mucilaginibacter sp. TaxID=797541 RepID=UPI0025ED1A51|nr:DUF892 family protein [uncultured Mucilaginibacter sp.]
MESPLVYSASADVMKKHFVHHLNRVYFGKKYLQQHLPGLTSLASFKKLRFAIEEVIESVNNQVNRIEQIYNDIDAQPDHENCVPIIAIFKDAFETPDYGDGTCLLNDIDIILYLQLLEHINITSYRMLKILASALQYKNAEQLLIESFDESRDDDRLFQMIADEYLRTN